MAQQSKDVVIITGSSGFIGRATILKLAPHFTIIGLDRDQPPHPPPVAECVCVDLTSDSSVAAALERVRVAYGTRIASVIHLAAYFDLTGEPNPLYEQVTVRGTERLLHGLQDFEVEQFVFSSTMLVHAPTAPGRPINEDAPLDPKLPYRRSKVKTERLIHEKRGTIPTVIVRPAGVYDDLCHSPFLAQQIANIYERKLISRVYPGDIRRGQAFLHLDDLTEALLRVVQRRHDLPAETTLLLGEPEALSYDERQRLIGRLIHDEDWETREIPKGLAKTGAWLMLSCLIFGTQPPLAHSDHLVGALIITVAVFAMAEVARPLRLINVLFGAWLLGAPWILAGGTTAGALAGAAAGLVLILLSLPRGVISREHYGSWDRYVV